MVVIVWEPTPPCIEGCGDLADGIDGRCAYCSGVEIARSAINGPGGDDE